MHLGSQTAIFIIYHNQCGLALAVFVLHLLGAMKAYNGEWWSPPMTPRFVR